MTAAAALLSLLLFLAAFCTAFAEGGPAAVLDAAELTLVKGKSQKLKVSLENTENPKKAQLTWESSDPAVAAVDKGGTVKAKDGGSAVITCTVLLADGTVLSASVPVTVTVPVQSLKIQTKANTAVLCGETLQLEFTLQPDNATDRTVTWSSADENILRVDENGAVTAIAAGKTTVTATASNGKTAKVSLCVPTLKPSAGSFRVTAADSVYHFSYFGADFDRNVQISAKGNCFSYTLVRNDPDIGVSLTALAPGEGTLTVSDKKDAGAKFTVAVTVTDDAFPAGRLLLVRDAAYDPASGVLTVQWTNTGSTGITGAELRFNPRNREGQPLVIGDGFMEEILLEERVFHIYKETAPGENVTSSFVVGGNYPDTDSLEIAFDRIDRNDGTSVILPDDRLCWYSTAQKAYVSGPENSEPYTPPADDLLALAAGSPLGFTAVAVTGELAECYGFTESGMLAAEIREGSAAASAGLQAGDLVFGLNGIKYRSEPYLVTLAAAEAAAGKPVTLSVLREGSVLEIPLGPAQ